MAERKGVQDDLCGGGGKELKMNKGAFTYTQNHGWRTISVGEKAEALVWLDGFAPQNKEEQRAKTILELFLRDGLSAQGIERLQHPDIVGIGNRSRGKNLTSAHILRVIYQYFPQFQGRNRGNTKDKERLRLMREREKKDSPHIKACAFCGKHDELEEHHMIPLFMGGTNDEANLVYLCRTCHKTVSRYQNELRRKAAN